MSIFPTIHFVFHEHVELGEYDELTRKQKIYLLYWLTDLPSKDFDQGAFFELFAGEDTNLDEYLAYYIFKTGLVDSVEFDFWLNDEDGRAEQGGHFIEMTIDDLEPGKISGVIGELKMAIEREFYIKPPASLKKFMNCTFETEFDSSREQALEEYVNHLGLYGALMGHAKRWLSEEQRPERIFRKTTPAAC